MNVSVPAGPTEAAIALAVMGAVLLVISIPIWRVWIRRNYLYGARTRVSLASDTNWRIVNRRSGRAGVQAGAALVVVALIAWLVLPEGWSDNVYGAIVVVAVLGALAWPVREMFAGEEETPRTKVTLWPHGAKGRPREDEGSVDRNR